jgi:hypothetical protein
MDVDDLILGLPSVARPAPEPMAIQATRNVSKARIGSWPGTVLAGWARHGLAGWRPGCSASVTTGSGDLLNR